LRDLTRVDPVLVPSGENKNLLKTGRRTFRHIQPMLLFLCSR